MAFDYGLRQIGVASGNTLTGTSSEVTVLRARDGVPDWDSVAALFTDWRPALVVVGLPLNMDDTEGELADRARKFGRRLQGRFNIPVEYVDERLSSHAAKSMLREQGHRGDYREAPADALAARLILDTWLAAHAE
ncbi:MAG: Holliday junction resolvase RuvX [Halieaceae bacterium]|jgi:putative Holliday junction resolvase|nr:Holliday junction resolvase RuvX [Halieaceae bacterium]